MGEGLLMKILLVMAIVGLLIIVSVFLFGIWVTYFEGKMYLINVSMGCVDNMCINK